MASIAELEYDLREAIKQYQDDSELSSSYIMYLWSLKRAKYLRNDLNNLQKTVDNSILQTVCLALERVSIQQCNVNYNCDTIVRTVKPIPKPLELHLRSAITTVKSVNKIDVPFNFVSKDRAVYQQHAPFGKAIYCFLDDDRHLYFISNSEVINLIECITVTGIFEDPLDLQTYSNCCGCDDPQPCFDINQEYPLQAHHIDNIRTELVQLLVARQQIEEDKTNNSND